MQVASSRNSTLEGNGEIAIGVGEALTLKEAASDARENLARILRSPTLRIQENQSVFTGGQVRWLVDWVLGKLQWVFRHPGFSNMHAALNRLANKCVHAPSPAVIPHVCMSPRGGLPSHQMRVHPKRLRAVVIVSSNLAQEDGDFACSRQKTTGVLVVKMDADLEVSRGSQYLLQCCKERSLRWSK